MVSINRETKLLLPRIPLEQTTLECVKRECVEVFWAPQT